MHILAPNKNKQSFSANKMGFLFEGDTTADVLAEVWETVQRHGKEYKSQRGSVKSIKGTCLIINDPLKESKNYPFWKKADDDWYQQNFVKKETNNPPEFIKKGQDIYAYKYAWRSRYHDDGWGYVMAVLELFKKQGIKKLKFKTKKDLVDFLKDIYQLYHPEIVLAVLAWKGERLINFYLDHPELAKMELAKNRSDIFLSVIDEVKLSPNTRRAITPSFTYEHIDHGGISGGVPVYQNYQLYVDFDSKNEPNGLISMHLHRAFDAKGGAQLDISHDREWGQIASKKLGLPLKKIIIYCNDLWYQMDESEIRTASDIRSWLFSMTDAYDPKIDDIEKRISSPSFQKKLALTLTKLQS